VMHVKCIHDLCSLSTSKTWSPRIHLDLKPTIYTPLGRFRDGAAKKYKTHETDLKTARIGGEMLPEPLPVAPLTPSTPSPLAT
jgi:hypothetical protein